MERKLLIRQIIKNALQVPFFFVCYLLYLRSLCISPFVSSLMNLRYIKQ